jgi:ribosomal protein S8
MNQKAEKEFKELMFNLFILQENGDISVIELLKDISIDNLETWIDWAFQNQETAKQQYPIISDILFQYQIKFNKSFVFAHAISDFPKHFDEKIRPNIEKCKIRSLKEKLIKNAIDFVEMLLNTAFSNEIEKNSIEKIKPHLKEILQYLKKPPQQKPELTFKDLFLTPYNTDEKINELKEILKQHHYIDETGTWTGRTEHGTTRETPQAFQIAILYYVLRDKKIINNDTEPTPALKIWCKEFNKLVAESNGKGVFTTVKNLMSHSNNSTNRTYQTLDNLFSHWKIENIP